MTLNQVTSKLLRQAIELYLDRAYPDGAPSEAVRQRAQLPEGRAGADLLSDPRWERVPGAADAEAAARFNLRLGNNRYPHMKLGVDRVSGSDQFVLVVDTHDKHFAQMVQAGEQAEYRELLEHNARVQHEIERAWTAAGLPTFERFLRSRLTDMAGGRGGRDATTDGGKDS